MGGGAAVAEVPEVATDRAGGAGRVKSSSEWRGAALENAIEAGGERSFTHGDDDGFAAASAIGGDGGHFGVISTDCGVFVADFGRAEFFAGVVAKVPKVTGDLAAVVATSAGVEVDGEWDGAFDFVGGNECGEALVEDFDGNCGTAFVAVAVGDLKGDIISAGVLEGVV